MKEGPELRRRQQLLPTLGIVAALFAGTLGACSSSNAPTTSGSSPSSVAFQMGYFEAPEIFPLGIAHNDFGNLKMTPVAIDSGPAALPLVANGQMAGMIDISEPPVAIAFAKNIPIKIVWLDEVGPVELLVRPGIKTAADLKGKKIAAPGGSIVQYLLERYLQLNGMTLTDIQFADLGAPDLLAAYRTGAIDGAYIWPPQSDSIQAAGATVLDQQTEVNFTVFSSAFISAHKPVVQAFICDMAKTQSRFLADPSAAYAELGAKYSLSPAAAEVALPKEGVVDPSQELSTQALGTPGQFSFLTPRIPLIGAWMKAAGRVNSAPTQTQAANLIDQEFAQVVVNRGCS